MGADKTAFLRPEFTALLTAKILTGESLNLISPHGQGRRRTLHDLRHNLPEKLHLFHFNMRAYKSDHKVFYDSLSMQANATSTATTNLHELFDKLDNQSHHNLLILHNFDELRQSENIDSLYDEHFFQTLRSIQKRHTIALLCVSEKAYDHYRLHADGSEDKQTHINAIPIALPPLSDAQLLAELRRRDGSKTTPQLRSLSATLLHQSAPYSALEQLFPI